MQRIGKRYQLEAELGRGAMGIIYRAVDRLTGETVALKRVWASPEVLHLDTLRGGTDLRLALSREFQALAMLHHPYLIGVLDYGFDERQEPFFTMEYLPDARTLVNAGAGQPDEIKGRLLVQLLQALAYIHRQGVIHRDLKPSNVLVSGGRVKVLDFGLAALAGSSRGISGSLAYLAPELLQGTPATVASDLYAVGVLAYELFAGQHPFQTEDLGALLDAIRGAEPCYSQPGIPPAVTLVLQGLLAKDPAARYSEAPAVIRALGEALGPALVEETEAVRESFLQAAAFVGREVELERLTVALEAARAGRGSGWLIGGESGVGKSRLLHELRTRALVQGMLVLEGRTVAEGGQSYQLWCDVARWLAIEGEPDDLEAGVLRLLVPDIEGLLERPIPEAPVLDPEAMQTRLLAVMMLLLRRCAQQTPVLLLLEDLHWAGDNCLTLLQWISRQVKRVPVLILASYRDEDVPGLPERLRAMEPLHLERLAEESVAALAVAMLGEDGRRPELVAFLQRETEGNAFFLVEVVRALAEELGSPGLAGEGGLPERFLAGGMAAVVQRRLNRVPGWATSLLQLAAVTGQRIQWPVLRAVPNVDWAYWLTACANAAVLERQGDQWQFAHDKLREGVLVRLSPGERQYLHQFVAETLEQHCAGDFEAYAAELTYHYREAANPERECRYALLAGKQAAAQHANRRALSYLARVLALTPETDPAGRFDALLVRANIYHWVGPREAQRRDLEQLAALAEQLNDPRRRAEVALRWAEYYERTANYAEALVAAEKAVALWQGLNAPDLEAQSYAIWGMVLIRLGEHATAQERFEQGLARGKGIPVVEAHVFRGLGMIARSEGNQAEALAYQSRALELCRAMGDRRGAAFSLNNLGSFYSGVGIYDQGWEHFSQALQIFREVGERRGEGVALCNMANLLALMGCYERAQEHYEQALDILREIGDRSAEGMILALLGRLFCYLEEVAKGRAYTELGVAIARQVGNREVEAGAWTSLGLALRKVGEVDSAVEAYRHALEIRQEMGAPNLATEPLAGLAEVALARADLPTALSFVEQILDYLKTGGLDGTDEPFGVEWTCYRVLQAADDRRARAMLESAVPRLQVQASRIQNQTLRYSFLENVPAHRGLLSAWRSEAGSGMERE